GVGTALLSGATGQSRRRVSDAARDGVGVEQQRPVPRHFARYSDGRASNRIRRLSRRPDRLRTYRTRRIGGELDPLLGSRTAARRLWRRQDLIFGLLLGELEPLDIHQRLDGPLDARTVIVWLSSRRPRCTPARR